MNEVDKFFGELPSEDKREQDIFNTKSTEEVVPPKDPVDADEDEPRKNRRHRRLEEALQRERESNIALNERVRTLAEMTEARNSEKENLKVDERFVRLFGDNEQGKEISRHFTQILAETKFEAKEEAIREFEQQQVETVQQQRQYEQLIDDQLESLEDAYNIDLTSDAPKARKARREFLELVQDLSPKDEDGTITDYADFDSTFQVYQKTSQERPDDSQNRRRDIASRSLGRTNNSVPTEMPKGRMDFARAKNEINKLLNQ